MFPGDLLHLSLASLGTQASSPPSRFLPEQERNYARLHHHRGLCISPGEAGPACSSPLIVGGQGLSLSALDNHNTLKSERGSAEKSEVHRRLPWSLAQAHSEFCPPPSVCSRGLGSCSASLPSQLGGAWLGLVHTNSFPFHPAQAAPSPPSPPSIAELGGGPHSCP